ncbi:hypothetical protein [Mesorhizobium australicum]|uniref:hypothetical protein n=1 Tax=Mesorhizobium australicum TaxID=536018 RepID=UPI0003CE5772|nr:hypothetical protein X741_10460 [Mesorhizobium sp. LNHC229A00]
MKEAGQIWSSTCLMPTVWPAKKAEIDLLSVETDAAACGDGDGLVVKRVIEVRQASVAAW